MKSLKQIRNDIDLGLRLYQDPSPEGEACRVMAIEGIFHTLNDLAYHLHKHEGRLDALEATRPTPAPPQSMRPVFDLAQLGWLLTDFEQYRDGAQTNRLGLGLDDAMGRSKYSGEYNAYHHAAMRVRDLIAALGPHAPRL